eukprot:TRINITY_DN1244_c0_g1_i2.p1 TRINITY_DN1244_c0_g1~~TRINITY_DN1244_c0_g1_i2.p1  ORF type:complete len:1317 (+),score=324.31 TRINITY_DN1244_c0_g1_i2:184-4134(+)
MAATTALRCLPVTSKSNAVALSVPSNQCANSVRGSFFGSSASLRHASVAISSRRHSAVSVKAAVQTEVSVSKVKSQYEIQALTNWLLNKEQAGVIDNELAVVLSSISLACRQIGSLVTRAGISNLTGVQGAVNVQGEDQKKLDVISNEVFSYCLRASGRTGIIASEEEDTPVAVEENYSGNYIVVFDPLDGSSNIDAAVSTGSIFGIYKGSEGCFTDLGDSPTLDDIEKTCIVNVCQPGSALVAAGYCMYSSSTIMVLSVGEGTYGFTLDPTFGKFVMTHDKVQIPKSGKIYSFNEGNYAMWSEGLKKYMDSLKMRARAARVTDGAQGHDFLLAFGQVTAEAEAASGGGVRFTFGAHIDGSSNAKQAPNAIGGHGGRSSKVRSASVLPALAPACELAPSFTSLERAAGREALPALEGAEWRRARRTAPSSLPPPPPSPSPPPAPAAQAPGNGPEGVPHIRFLQKCTQRRAVREAFSYLEEIPEPCLGIFTQVVATCAAAGSVEGANRAFRAAKAAGLQPDCQLYTALMGAYCKGGRLDEAFKVFHEMEAAGVAANRFTFGTLIDGCSKSKQVAKAFGVYGIMMSRKVAPDRHIFHALIEACGKSNSLDRAFDVLQDMKAEKVAPDDYTTTLLLTACNTCGQVERAMGVYRVMRKKGFAKSPAPFTAAINACSTTGSLEAACKIYRDMLKDKVKPDEMVYCALMKVATAAGNVEKAFALLPEMRLRGLTPSIMAYDSLLNTCCKMGLPERAVEVYRTLTAERCKPGVSTFNALLQTLCDAGQLDEALGLLDAMGREGVLLNARSYIVLLGSCAKAKRVDVGVRLFHDAELEGHANNLTVCSAMLDLCFEQIRRGGYPPSYVMAIDNIALNTALLSPRQQWASYSLHIYEQTVAAGVVPTRALLSKLLGCLRCTPTQFGSTAWRGANASASASASRGEGEGGATGAEFQLSSFGKGYQAAAAAAAAARGSDGEEWDLPGKVDRLYDQRCIALYEHAAAMGVVPQVSVGPLPAVINLTGLPTHAAEVCLLAFLKGLVRRKSFRRDVRDQQQARCRPVTLLFESEEVSARCPRDGEEGSKQRTVRLALRTGQVVAALLRHLEVPFSGFESSGSLQIAGTALQKWRRQAGGEYPVLEEESASEDEEEQHAHHSRARRLPPGIARAHSHSRSERLFPPRLGRGIALQQRAIRGRSERLAQQGAAAAPSWEPPPAEARSNGSRRSHTESLPAPSIPPVLSASSPSSVQLRPAFSPLSSATPAPPPLLPRLPPFAPPAPGAASLALPFRYGSSCPLPDYSVEVEALLAIADGRYKTQQQAQAGS